MDALFTIGLYTLILSFTGVGNLRIWAMRQLLVVPNERSSHTQPTPSGGGVAITVSTLLGILFFALMDNRLSSALWYYCAGSALIALISWYDDLHTAPTLIRIGVHSVGAIVALVAVGGFTAINLPFIGLIHFSWFGYGLGFLWLVGLTNAYNFMDGIDGLAGSQAVVAGALWAVLGHWLNEPLLMALGLFIFAGSCGFLYYNWPPARIFMGDVGSTFLGFSFGVITLLATGRDAHLALVGALVLWPFLFDTLFTIIRRGLKGENILLAHRSHLYQRLVIAGYHHRTVTLLYALLAIVGGVMGLLWWQQQPGSQLTIVVGIPALILMLLTLVRISEARAGQPDATATEPDSSPNEEAKLPSVEEEQEDKTQTIDMKHQKMISA